MKKKQNLMFRQGDVLIQQVDSLPKELKDKKVDNGRVVLAYGEVTGHAHAISEIEKVEFSTDIQETRTFLKVKEEAELTHEEHTTIRLPVGDYEVIQQSEYTMQEIRRVAD